MAEGGATNSRPAMLDGEAGSVLFDHFLFLALPMEQCLAFLKLITCKANLAEG